MLSIFHKLFHGSVARAEREGFPQGELERDKTSEGLVILGVLLNEVALAEGGLSPEEDKAILGILSRRGGIQPHEAGLAVAAAHEAAQQRPDIQGFTREVNKLPYEDRVKIVELLFEVAFADDQLHFLEVASIRKISGLLWVTHEDFIKAKLKVQKAHSPAEKKD